MTRYPAARAAASIAAMDDAGPYWELWAVSTPIVRERLVTRARAARFGRYCTCSITSSTRWRVSARSEGESLSTRETVWCDTPARRATSRMLGALPRGVSVVIIDPVSVRASARRRLLAQLSHCHM